jgi:dipeptidyl aminopeptidase/acylaminoacyl peptidase
MTAEDLYGFRWVSEPQLSPDGERVAYVQTHIDAESDEYRSAVYVARADGGGEPERWTYGPKRDWSPRWSPDGSLLLFLSDRDGMAQAYAMPSTGGEARALTAAPNPVGQAVWSPDGGRIAYVSVVGADLSEEHGDVLGYHYTEAHFKDDGEGIKRGRRQLFTQALDGGAAVQLTEGEYDYGSPTWSPDGSSLAVVSDRSANRPFTGWSDIYLVSAEGGEPRRLTCGEGPAHSPAFSPDGATLAYLGHTDPPGTGRSTNLGVWTVPVVGGDATCLTAGFDQTADNDVNSDSRWGPKDLRPVWVEDGSRLLFVASDRGAAPLYEVDAEGGETRAIGSGRPVVDAFSVAGDRVVCLRAEQLNPGDLYASALDGSGETRLARVNEEFLSGFELSTPEEVSIPSTEGVELHGWIMKPSRFVDGERYPLIIEVHGGPHTSYGYAFFHEFQVLAARGFGVLYTNPRGSTGYGQAHAACIVKEWGVRDYQDVMAAADWAETLPWVDPRRMGITGGSYGGFMTNWAVGHTDRFRAGVTARSVSNFSSFYGTSDIGPSFAEWHVGGTPWDNPEGYARSSPITYIREMRTPLLIIHQEGDHRCAVDQAEQLFVGLKRLGCEAEFLRFPGESHDLSRSGKPKRRVERLNRITEWFERHMRAVE